MRLEALKIEQAVSALLTSGRVDEAAQKVGVSRSTFWRITASDDFQSCLNEARASLISEAVSALLAHTFDSIEVLHNIATDETAPTASRVSAASKILDLSLKASENLELRQRVKELEKELQNRNEFRSLSEREKSERALAEYMEVRGITDREKAIQEVAEHDSSILELSKASGLA